MSSKRFCFAFMVMMLLGCTAWAQPELTWLKTVHDYGSFSDTLKKVDCLMPFVNTGNEPLVITQVRPSCGCTVAEYPRMPIAPGDTAAVQLSFYSRNIPGEFQKDVLVYSNTTPRKSVIMVKGIVIGSPESVDEKYPYGDGAIRFTHNSLPLGEVTKGRWREAYFTGYNTAQEPMRARITGLPAHITARALPDTIVPGKLVTISLFYDSWKAPLWGLNTDTIAIETFPLADSTAISTMPFTVMAQVKEDFTRLSDKERREAPEAVFSTDKLDFGTLTHNEAATSTLTIKNEGKRDLVIRRLYIPDGHITAQADMLTVKKGKKATISVTVNDLQEAVLNTTLTVITNDPYRPRQTVRLVGLNQK